MNKKIIWLPAVALSVLMGQNVMACDGSCSGYSEHKSHEGHMMGKHFDKMVKKLDLTADQEKKIKAIQSQTKASMEPKYVELRTITMQLNDLAKADVINEGKMDDLITQKEKVIGEITKMRVMTRYQINHVLDAKQKAKMDKMTMKMREKVKAEMGE